ncbi:unnamed protein product [Ixodes persulcatus]
MLSLGKEPKVPASPSSYRRVVSMTTAPISSLRFFAAFPRAPCVAATVASPPPLPQAHSFPTVWGRRDSGSFACGPTFPFSPARVAAFALGFPSSLSDLGEEGFGRNRDACAQPSSSLFRPLLADVTMLSAFAARSFQIAAGFPAGRIVSPVVASSGRLDIIDPLSVGCGPGKD